jgi:hypothetical protein
VRKADLFLLLKSRHKKQKSRSQRVMAVFTPAAKLILACLSLVLLGVFFVAGWTYAKIAINLPPIEILPILLDAQNGELLQPTRLTDRSGNVTLAHFQIPGSSEFFCRLTLMTRSILVRNW